MTFIGLATLIYLVIYKVEAKSTISEITFSPSKEIDISSGPVSVILSFEFTVEQASIITDIELWYNGGYRSTFECRAWTGFYNGDDPTEISKLFGSGPYQVSSTECETLPHHTQNGRHYFKDIVAGEIDVKLEYSRQSLAAATNVWTAALMSEWVNGSVLSSITTLPAITTVGVLARNLTIHTSVFPDGSIIMNFKCTIGPVTPKIELILTLPPSAEIEQAKGNNSVSIRIPYNAKLDGATVTCEAYIVHPRPTVLPKTKDVEYPPMYLEDSFTTVCQIPCHVDLLCSQRLIAYPKASITLWWEPDMVTNSPLIAEGETVTIKCTATNKLGNATQNIFAHITRPSDTIHLSSVATIAALSAALLVVIGMGIYSHYRATKMKQHQESSSQRQRLITNECPPIVPEDASAPTDYYESDNHQGNSSAKIETGPPNNTD